MKIIIQIQPRIYNRQIMRQEIEHIDIPVDELGIFKNTNQQKYQNILIQTVILTTLGTIHENNKNYKAQIFVTVKSIWIIKKQKIKYVVPIKSIAAVVKSFKHPELVIITKQDLNNIRITTSSQQRSYYIISALSYNFTYVFTKKLCLISVKHGTLDYFERTAQEKQQNRNINLESYARQYIEYKKPFKDNTDVYGYIKDKAKIVLQKQLQIIKQQNNNHAVYVARVEEFSTVQSFRHDKNQQKEDRYICHYVDKNQQYLQKLFQHKNINFITELMYAKVTEFKIQILFQYSISLRGIKMTPFIFNKIWKIYDKCKNINKSYVLTTDSLQLVQRNGILGEKIRRTSSQCDDQQKMRWVNGQYQILVKQFRYKFLNEAVEWESFMYEPEYEPEVEQQTIKNKVKFIDIESSKITVQQQLTSKIYQQQQQQAQTTYSNKQTDQQSQKQNKLNKYFSTKLYNIGLILYELCTGRHLFSYMPAFINEQQIIQQQIQLILQFKQMIKRQRIQIFPKFLDLCIEQPLKKFIECCIYRQFKSQEQMLRNQWLNRRSSKIINI